MKLTKEQIDIVLKKENCQDLKGLLKKWLPEMMKEVLTKEFGTNHPIVSKVV